MRAKSVSMREIAAVVAAIVVNAVILSQVVGGISSTQPTSTFAQGPYMNGDPCMVDTDCISDICQQGTCCDRACDGVHEICNNPANPGVCSAVLPAPSLSWPGQFLAATLLTLLGWFGLRRMRRAM